MAAKYIDGALTGKLGNFIVCQGRDGPYLRSRPKRNAPPTEKERQNHHVFRLVQQWLRPVSEFVLLGFRAYRKKGHGYSAAVSMLYKQGLLRNGFDSRIDPSLVMLSCGKLGLPERFDLLLDAERRLHFSWDTGVDHSKHPRDRIMLLAYNVEAGEAEYQLSGPQRYEGKAVLDLSLMPIGSFHIYVAFQAADGKGQSDSRYLGEVLVGPVG